MNNDMALRNTIITPEGETTAPRPLDVSTGGTTPAGGLQHQQPRRPGDAIAVGARARQLAMNGGNGNVGVLSFWDHDTRTAPIGERHLEIDPSGSYRLE